MKMINIGEICSINPNSIRKDYTFEYIKYVDISSVGSGNVTWQEEISLTDAPSRAKRIPQNEDTVISTVRPGNRSFFYCKNIPSNTVVSTGFAVLRPDKTRIDPRYLYYAVSSVEFTNFLVSQEKGSNYPAVTPDIIERGEIYYHALPTQKKIASILSTFDDLIENNLKRIKLLEEAAELIYREWFVNLRFPGHEKVKVVDGVPEGWEKGNVGDFYTVKGGGTPSTKHTEYWSEGNIPWFSPTDLSKANSISLLNSDKKITELGLQKSSAQLLSPDFFMMTSRATIGLFGLVQFSYSTNQGFINIKARDTFGKLFALYHFKNRVEEIKGFATGATFLEISKSKFKALKAIYPDTSTLQKFSSSVSPFIELLFNLEKQNKHLKQTRDLLLPRLIDGSIDVEKLNLEEYVKEVQPEL